MSRTPALIGGRKVFAFQKYAVREGVPRILKKSKTTPFPILYCIQDPYPDMFEELFEEGRCCLCMRLTENLNAELPYETLDKARRLIACPSCCKFTSLYDRNMGFLQMFYPSFLKPIKRKKKNKRRIRSDDQQPRKRPTMDDHRLLNMTIDEQGQVASVGGSERVQQMSQRVLDYMQDVSGLELGNGVVVIFIPNHLFQ